MLPPSPTPPGAIRIENQPPDIVKPPSTAGRHKLKRISPELAEAFRRDVRMRMKLGALPQRKNKEFSISEQRKKLSYNDLARRSKSTPDRSKRWVERALSPAGELSLEDAVEISLKLYELYGIRVSEMILKCLQESEVFPIAILPDGVEKLTTLLAHKIREGRRFNETMEESIRKTLAPYENFGNTCVGRDIKKLLQSQCGKNWRSEFEQMCSATKIDQVFENGVACERTITPGTLKMLWKRHEGTLKAIKQRQEQSPQNRRSHSEKKENPTN